MEAAHSSPPVGASSTDAPAQGCGVRVDEGIRLDYPPYYDLGTYQQLGECGHGQESGDVHHHGLPRATGAGAERVGALVASGVPSRSSRRYVIQS